jgi:alpha-D-ribose 1-methylphosphonate 5-triphosphate synthase subunit PhnG
VLISMTGAGTRTRRLRCGTELKSRPVPSSRHTAAAKALVIYNVIRFVENGHGTLRERRGGVLELTFVTGEVFRLGKTTVTRIY